MARLNCFIDETGQDDMSSGIYLTTLVFHDHSKKLDGALEGYSRRLAAEDLPDIPFHMVDLIHGHGDYENMGPERRKPLLYAFATFVRTLPISYLTLEFDARDTKGKSALESRIRKEVSDFIFSRLEETSRSTTRLPFITTAVALWSGKRSGPLSISPLPAMWQATGSRCMRRDARSQAADYLTSIELASIRYDQGCASKIDTSGFSAFEPN